MRSIKMLGVAALAALAATAFIGVASASATQVCSANQTGSAAGCAGSGFLYGTDVLTTDTLSGHLVPGTTSDVSNSAIVTISCTSSSVAGGVSSDGANGAITDLKFPDPNGGSCSEGPVNTCTITTHPNYPATVTDTPNEPGSDGTFTVTIPPDQAVNVVCAGAVTCDVSGTAQGSLYNPSNESAPGAPLGGYGYATASFTANSGSSLSGCGVGEDTYTALYEIDAGDASAGVLHIE